MKKIIMDSLPERFMQLQQERQQAKERLVVLAGKLEEHRRKVADTSGEIKRLEAEIAEVVAIGGDPATQLRKIRSNRDSMSDLQNVVVLAENAVEAAKGVSAKISKQMEEIFQKSIMEARNVVAEGLQTELQDIENRVNEWRTVVFSMSDQLGLPAPNSGTEIILLGLR